MYHPYPFIEKNNYISLSLVPTIIMNQEPWIIKGNSLFNKYIELLEDAFILYFFKPKDSI